MTRVYKELSPCFLRSRTAYDRCGLFIELGGNFSHVRPVLLLDVRIVVFFELRPLVN